MNFLSEIINAQGIAGMDFLDAFSGAGGASLGIKRAGGRVQVAVNHDPRAIWAHTANHPETLHFNDDIRSVSMADVARHLHSKGITKVCIWWSAECTHFSNAKGGESRDRDSRMLSEDLIRWVRDLEANGITVLFIFVENVGEFLGWCPIKPKRRNAAKGMGKHEQRYCRAQIESFDAVARGDSSLKAALDTEMDALYESMRDSGLYEFSGGGKAPSGRPLKPTADDGKLRMLPDPKTKGLLYMRWHEWIEAMGYEYQWRMLNAADFGAYQSRERYFGIFKHRSITTAINWPMPTHAKNPTKGTLFDAGLQPWKPCRDILDLSDRGKSILYGRHGMEPLVEATVARIEYGINKFGPSSTMIDRSNTGASPTSSNDPLPTVRASFENAVVQVNTVDNCTFGQEPFTPDSPLSTVMAKRDKYLMSAFVVPGNYGNPPAPINAPLQSVLASRHHHSLCTPFIDNQYGVNGRNVGSTGMEQPIGSVTTNPKQCLVYPFIAHQYSSNGSPRQVSGVNEPSWALTTYPKERLVLPLIAKYYGTGENVGSVDSPIGTVTTKDRFMLAHCRFIGHYYGGMTRNGIERIKSLDESLSTVAAARTMFLGECEFMSLNHNGPFIFRLMPKYAKTKRGNHIWPCLSKTRIVLIEKQGKVIGGYEVDRRIVDIHYRMLKVGELKLAQGFPADYILDPKSETIAKKHIGNAVHVGMAEVLVAAQRPAFEEVEKNQQSCFSVA